jgi:hypothetical protein
MRELRFKENMKMLYLREKQQLSEISMRHQAIA